METITDAEELESILWGDHLLYDTVATIAVGRGLWSTRMKTVFKRMTDGKLFIMYWSQATTEYPEHELPEIAHEAVSYTEPVTKYRRAL